MLILMYIFDISSDNFESVCKVRYAKYLTIDVNLWKYRDLFWELVIPILMNKAAF